MVTIKVNNLIDFVADVFSHAESSAEEARRIALHMTRLPLTQSLLLSFLFQLQFRNPELTLKLVQFLQIN